MEAGFEHALVYFDQPSRKRGKSTYNFYRLYDVAMLGITSHSKVPLRLATMLGFAMSALSFLVGMGYLVYKLLFWKQFTLGIAPLLIAVFFLGSLQLFFTGILGEYIGFIYTHVRKRPLVIEKERINFYDPAGDENALEEVSGGGLPKQSEDGKEGRGEAETGGAPGRTSPRPEA